ncbi:MAG: nucleotidyl transferase AbiEii/AbiGii toxin family protein [Verrucomicrobia bacterium]|nr:nucleotidyl transferase AbiEii/AbiGii toxin family protein [Verrucomicrobiota bacterium]
MTMRQFYDWQTAGGGDDVTRLVATLERLEIAWCMIGGLAVNHWAREPLATADVDVVIASAQVEAAVKALCAAGFKAKRFVWSVNLKGRSQVAVQISTEQVYEDFPSRSVPADIHGILMRVASREDTLRGKLLAYQDPQRRASKRQKDLLDIMRMVEAHPKLRKSLPTAVAKKLVG